MDYSVVQYGRVLVQRIEGLAWWGVWLIVSATFMGATPSWGQTAAAPNVVRSPSRAATIPPGNDGATGGAPRTDDPQVGERGMRPIPDTGVIAPPATGAGAVIQPPASGSMPVIPPPGSAGGASGVVPK